MDFNKIMRISLIDIGAVDFADQLFTHAEAIMERLGLSPREAKIAKELTKARSRAISDYKLVMDKYRFPIDENEIIFEDHEYMQERLVREGEKIFWQAEFMGITDPTQKWHGKVEISERELFELYKAEFIYENLKEYIPRDFKAYYERCYGLAGMFNVFISGTKAK